MAERFTLRMDRDLWRVAQQPGMVVALLFTERRPTGFEISMLPEVCGYMAEIVGCRPLDVARVLSARIFNGAEPFRGQTYRFLKEGKTHHESDTGPIHDLP